MKILNKASVAGLAVALIFGLVESIWAATAVDLGAADDFAVLAGEGITIGGAVNTTTITGDIGTFPTASITGIGNAILNGTNHAGDAVTQGAKTALTAAYGNAEGQTLPSVTTVLASDIDSFSGTGYTLAPGIYKSLSTLGITGTLTLDGSATDVWIFQAGSSLTTAGASVVNLTGGAQACNVFWQVGSSATLGADSTFKGNVLALTSIGLGTTANVEGRVLAQNGTVTLDGSNVITKATCVAPPPPPPAPTPNPSFEPVPPLLSVIKVPNPLALPAGPGSVTYGYTVLNVGYTDISNVALVDNKCSPVNFVFGDTDSDSVLDISEIWTYRCTTTLPQTTTNTVTATGEAGGRTAIDTANATVVVGLPVPPPLINIVKKPASLNLLFGGGPMTYIYTVTNPGTAPLSNVSVVDDKCTGLPGRVVGHPGDLNGNNLLESNEMWSFTCRTNITQTTTNTATAEGHANGLTAIDFALATVVVAPPKLPDTGIAPDGNDIPWSIAIPVGALAAISLLYAFRRKLTA